MATAEMRRRDDTHWVGTCATTPDLVQDMALTDQTRRMITRVSVGGVRVRVRLSNA